MKEYRIRFNKRPGGPDVDDLFEAYFIELKDDQGTSLKSLGPYEWKDEGDSVVLTLPTYEGRFKTCHTTLCNIKNTIEWAATNWHDPLTMLQDILTEVEEALEDVKEM